MADQQTSAGAAAEERSEGYASEESEEGPEESFIRKISNTSEGYGSVDEKIENKKTEDAIFACQIDFNWSWPKIFSKLQRNFIEIGREINSGTFNLLVMTTNRQDDRNGEHDLIGHHGWNGHHSQNGQDSRNGQHCQN